MTRSNDDNFMIQEILPAIRRALHMEDAILQTKLRDSKHAEFYSPENANIQGISYSLLTERAFQYVIVRELCTDYKLLYEDGAYADSPKQRLDLSIYRDEADIDQYAEIGIEIKYVLFTKKGTLKAGNRFNGLVKDFEKIKKAGNKSKYLLLLGVHEKDTVPLGSIEEQLGEKVSSTNHAPHRLADECFATVGDTSENFFHIVLMKVRPTR